MRSGLLAVLTSVVVAAAAWAQPPEPVFHQGFDDGKLDGPVGKAGPSLTLDGRGIVNMDRGTLAFFYQSAKDPAETEWGSVGTITTERDAGYWNMAIGFYLRKQEFLFNMHDAGGYAPPLTMPTVFGRWQAGQWHHLAAVWDREQGITVYEDGRQVASNWGEYQWEWTLIPARLALPGPVDEVYIYAEPLTAAQIAQLAQGQKPTGPPIAVSPLEQRRARELARLGWVDESLASMPVVKAGEGAALHFARIRGCVDAKRPVAYVHEGLLRSSWPSFKYGASIRGQKLEIALDPEQSYDRVRLFALRGFTGRLVRGGKADPEAVLDLEVPHAMFWHARLPRPLNDTALVLERDYGRAGHIDFYRVEAVSDAAAPGAQAYSFARAESFPDTDQGKTVMAETPRRHWNPVTATAAAVPAWKLETPAFGGFQAIAEPPQEARAFTGAQVELVVEGLRGPTPVRLEVKEPVDTERIWLAADVVLEPAGAGAQRFIVRMTGRPVINQPPMKTRKYLKDGKYSDTEFIDVPGVGVTFHLTAADAATWHLGAGGSTLKLLPADLEQVVETAADDQEEWMREAYAERMEGHGYSDPRLVRPLVWLAHFAPQRMNFRQMWERVDASKPSIVGIDIPRLEMPEIVNDTGAPDWAFWQMQAVERIRNHVHWIIDHKQVWTGEYGGVWNDDSTHVENWMGYMLALDGSGKIARSMRRYWDGVWTHQLIDGVGKYTQDAGHYSEEGSSNLGMRLLIDYGDPIAYERTLLASDRTKYWIADDPAGQGYVWKGFWTGPWGAWTEGAFLKMARGGGHQTDVIVPLGYLVWYNRHPKALDYLTGLDIRGAGFLGTARELGAQPEQARKSYEEILRKPVGRGGPAGDGHLLAVNEIGLSDEARAVHKVEYQPAGPIAHYWGSKDTDLHWWRWKVSGDDRFLVDSYRRVCEWFYSHDWLNSAAQPSMDRNPLPRASVIRSRLGATAANRGSSGNMWPQHAVSFAQGADEVASLVTENLPNQFAVRLYPFTDQPHAVQLRAWRCNGTFKVTLAADKNGDGQGDEVLWQTEMKLDRGAAIDLRLPPRQVSVLTVTPVQIEPENFDRPDPAISLSSIELVYGGHLVVNVYNNGTRPVEDVLVRVRDGRTGKVVINGEQRTGPIEAPLDLRPRFKMVEFKNITANTWDSFIVEIDPEQEIDDLNRHNNSVTLKYRATFVKHEGYR